MVIGIRHPGFASSGCSLVRQVHRMTSTAPSGGVGYIACRQMTHSTFGEDGASPCSLFGGEWMRSWPVLGAGTCDTVQHRLPCMMRRLREIDWSIRLALLTIGGQFPPTRSEANSAPMQNLERLCPIVALPFWVKGSCEIQLGPCADCSLVGTWIQQGSPVSIDGLSIAVRSLCG